jgi:staphylococcal nuclease domain-containing protein 1
MSADNTFPASGRATVKQILSSDRFPASFSNPKSIILRGKPSAGGPPPEKLLSLSYTIAPRMGTVKEPEKEEDFAYACREFVRKLLIGKEVQFKTDYKTIGNRDFGGLRLHPSNAIDGENDVTRIIVSHGWARVKPIEGNRDPAEEQLKLLELEAVAQAQGLGIWSSSPYTVRKYSNE